MLLQVFIAIVLAITAGVVFGPDAAVFGIPCVKLYGVLGQLFLNALTLVVVPLVASSIITGIARIGAEKRVGKLGMKTFGYFILMAALAVFVGFITMKGMILADGMPHKVPGGESLLLPVEGDTFDQFSAILFKVVPPNILAPAAQGQILGIILFCLFFGYFAARIESTLSDYVLGFWKGVYQVMMRMTHLVMKILPLGVFGLVAQVVATTGLEAIESVAWFFAAFLIGITLYAGVVLPLILKFIGGISPWKTLQALSPALVTAFSSSSTAASLPVTMECLEERAGVSNRVCSFTLPLGAAISLSGTALFICMASLYLAHVYAVPLTIPTQCMVVLLSFLTSFGIGGIPSASLVAVIIITQSMGIPPESLAYILGIERLLDMLRTTVNVFGNGSCAVLVAQSEGETLF